MPVLLRILCQGGMVVAPIFLLLLAVPLVEWEVDGRRMSYSELWSSGDGAALTVSLLLVSVGLWGLAARNRISRWLLVLAPVVPYWLFHPVALTVSSETIATEVIVGTAVTAIVFYLCFFHLSPVRDYFDGESVHDPAAPAKLDGL